MGPVGIVDKTKGGRAAIDAIAQVAAHHHDVGEIGCRKGAQLPVQDRLAGYADHALGNVFSLRTQAPAAASRYDDDFVTAHAVVLPSLRRTARIVRPA